MPIGSIITQPAASSINAAYRPIVFRVSATNTDATAKPPVVYCDIYFNSVYYKTLSKTQYVVLNVGTNTEWEFDIQDAAQEYLNKVLGANGGSVIIDAGAMAVQVLCKFRSSGFDADGFILSENTVPVQGTGGTAPTSGTGTSSNSFWVISATLQQQDNPSLASHLQSFRQRTWLSTAYPLTHRPEGYFIGINQSDYFPAIVDTATSIKKIGLSYRLHGQDTFHKLLYTIGTAITGKKVIYIPNGPKNLKPLFPTINFVDVMEYYVDIEDASNVVIATGTMNEVTRCDDVARIHFLNYAGTIDAINFSYTVNHEAKSDSMEKALSTTFVRSDHSAHRFNVKSNDTYTGTSVDYDEADMNWIDELLDSPLAWMEWTGVQGQADGYLPIVILDKKAEKRKEDDRFVYEVTLEFRLSNDRFIIRN